MSRRGAMGVPAHTRAVVTSAGSGYGCMGATLASEGSTLDLPGHTRYRALQRSLCSPATVNT